MHCTGYLRLYTFLPSFSISNYNNNTKASHWRKCVIVSTPIDLFLRYLTLNWGGLLYLRIQLVLAVAMPLQCEDAPRSEGLPWFAKYNSNISIIGHVPEEISQVYILVNIVISLSWFCFFLDARNCQVLSHSSLVATNVSDLTVTLL